MREKTEAHLSKQQQLRTARLGGKLISRQRASRRHPEHRQHPERRLGSGMMRRAGGYGAGRSWHKCGRGAGPPARQWYSCYASGTQPMTRNGGGVEPASKQRGRFRPAWPASTASPSRQRESGTAVGGGRWAVEGMAARRTPLDVAPERC
ncbi:hypothetical protein BS50DRAFT_384392 [Corynespora cassiicola Philippines]|uniref:Uncharacterized protein n=1 Tax=Corynespora cassiicola Philippines TaxID=1448308 RepID=A0A2T2NP37_CORCC|nr:hypothetical protein BS50DRAFT_384392 [Corynespora cassiicola Philippines]